MEDGNEVDREALALEARVQAEAKPIVEKGWEWALVEIFGHRSHAGRAREEERFGANMLRIDVPVKGDPAANGWETHWYGGSSIFSYTLTDEDSVMRSNKPYDSPSQYRLPKPEHVFDGEDDPEEPDDDWEDRAASAPAE